jgi:hypothetical protein
MHKFVSILLATGLFAGIAAVFTFPIAVFFGMGAILMNVSEPFFKG